MPTGPGRSFVVSDAKTGDELLSVATTKGGSVNTAVAMSRDGAFLAVAANEFTGKSRGTVRTYTSGVITVWDLKTKKVKWKVSGVEEEKTARIGVRPSLKGDVNCLAFSPDASRLAAMGKSLQIFTLIPDKEIPGSLLGEASPTGFAKGGYTGEDNFQWLPDNKSLIYQLGRDILMLDPNAGNKQDQFTLHYPARPAPEPSDNKLPPPDSGIPGAGNLEGWHEHQIIMSTDGSRLAAHIIGSDEREKERKNAVVIWDVPAHQKIGFLALPPQVATLQKSPRNIAGASDRGRSVKIALSGDGKRLAVADASGEIRVFDVAQIVANTKKDSPIP